MEFGDRLKQLREESRLTRGDLSDRLKVSYSTVSKYETNVRFPDKETLVFLADLFDVSLDYLLCRSDIRETAEKLRNYTRVQPLASDSSIPYCAGEELPPEAMEELESFREFILHKYRNK